MFLERSFQILKGFSKCKRWGFPGGAVVKNPPASAGDTGSSSGPGGPTCRGATKPVHHNY